jgi:putative ABC transport system permease protein
MSVAVRLAFAGLSRTPARTLVRLAVLAVASALLGAMVLFVGRSLSTMTAGAVRDVPLDWQGPVGSYAAAVRSASAVARQPGIQQASPAASAPLAAATHRGAAGVTTTGAGAVLAVPGDYLSHLATFRILQGTLAPGGVVLDQQLAATLQAQIGDRVALIPRRGAPPVRLPVSGIALVTAPDVLFAPLNPLSGPAPAQPPANIAIVGLDVFARRYAPALRTIVPASLGSSAVPGAQDGVQWQVQAQVDPRALTGSPAHALTLSEKLRNRVERSLPEQVQFVDNLHDQLTTAAGDALYAIALYIMLAVPGALIALGLAYLAALGTVERDRRDLGLLRARGGRRREVLALALADSAALGVGAGVLGAGLAFAATEAVVPGGAHLSSGRAAIALGVCVGLAFLGAAAARLASGARALTSSVAESRRGVRRERAPLWRRLGLDYIALAVSGLIYWLTARTGFSAVVNPDSNPTLSLAVYMFFAPALLWIGVTLLLVRLRGRLLGALARPLVGARARDWRGLLLVSAARRGAAINRGLIVVGLLLAFGVSLGIFTATYDQQGAVDAQLTLGADVTVSAPPGALAAGVLQRKVAAVRGVAASTAVAHSYAYVGPDLQDTFGIDPLSIAKATTLRDSYFLGGGAAQTLARLRARPDGVLVSKETIADYSLALGDQLNLRVLDARSGHFRRIAFHVVGVVQEFPSAPRDSFMVANLPYLQAVTHSGPNVIFVKASGDPTAVGRTVASATRADGTTVKDIRRQAVQTASSITAVDLGGIRDIEELFAVALAAAAMALFVALALAERRSELATMAAVGAPLRRIGAFLWSEVALVLALGVALAAGLGWLLSQMLVAMLQHVFDPPPDHLAVPWGYLAALTGAALGAALLAIALALRGLRRLPLGAVLREQ